MISEEGGLFRVGKERQAFEPIAKLAYFVTPAKAGGQKILKKLDTVFRRYDAQGLLQLAHLPNHIFTDGRHKK